MNRHDRLIRRLIRTRFTVTIVGVDALEETYEGVLLEADDMHLVLADAAQLSPTGDRLPVDGHLWLPRLSVKYLQQPTV